jgi:Arc/MetJ family transcription regulator
MIKRTNLMIDESLLKEAKKVLGADTYSAAVNEALTEVIRIARIKSLTGFIGSGAWSGDLSEMRVDKQIARFGLTYCPPNPRGLFRPRNFRFWQPVRR